MTESWASLIGSMWAAWGAYWVWSSRNVKRARRRESPASRAAHLVPLALAGALLAAPTIPGWLGDRWIVPGPFPRLCGTALVAAGLAISAWARRILGANWSASVTVKEHHEIVQAGPYAMVRHPIYTGMLLALAGSALASGEWRGLVAFAIASAALWRKLRVEELWLTEEFGERYLDYARRTRALIPFII